MSPSDILAIQRAGQVASSDLLGSIWGLFFLYGFLLVLFLVPFGVAALAFWRWVAWRTKYPPYPVASAVPGAHSDPLPSWSELREKLPKVPGIVDNQYLPTGAVNRKSDEK